MIVPCRIDPDYIITDNGLGMTAENDEEIAGLITQMKMMDANNYGMLAKKCQDYVSKNHDPAVKAKELTMIISGLISGESF